MARFGDHFDHNLHALRIIESFEQRYARFPGLNLTFEVREGIAKHSRDYFRGEVPVLDEYEPELRPTLEAQLIDLADEVAYNTADLDDGFSAGMLTAEEVAGHVPQYAAIYDAVEMQFPGASARERFYEALRQLIDWLVSGLIEGTVSRAAEAGLANAGEVRRFGSRVAAFTPAAAETNRELKRFLWENVYSSPAIGAERTSSTAMIAELFELFLAQPERMPEPYRQATESEAPHRVVCDYIAGMTDSFFRRTWAQITEREPKVAPLY
jgi:dGTPase